VPSLQRRQNSSFSGPDRFSAFTAYFLSSNLASFLRSRESMALPLASRADGRRSKKIEDRRYDAEHFWRPH
jgi:hypothetical protein